MTQGIQVWHVWQQNGSGSAFVVGKILLKFSIFVHMLIYFPYTQLYISHHLRCHIRYRRYRIGTFLWVENGPCPRHVGP
jgi:hypothetical protein